MTLDSVQIQNGISLLLMSLFLVLFSTYYHIINVETVSNIRAYTGCSGGYLKTMYCENYTHFMSTLLKDCGKLNEGSEKIHCSTRIL